MSKVRNDKSDTEIRKGYFMSKNNHSSTGVSVCGVLTIVFIVLKLIGVIHWSWVWVLCPLWISAIIVIVALVILFKLYK